MLKDKMFSVFSYFKNKKRPIYVTTIAQKLNASYDTIYNWIRRKDNERINSPGFELFIEFCDKFDLNANYFKPSYSNDSTNFLELYAEGFYPFEHLISKYEETKSLHVFYYTVSLFFEKLNELNFICKLHFLNPRLVTIEPLNKEFNNLILNLEAQDHIVIRTITFNNEKVISNKDLSTLDADYINSFLRAVDQVLNKQKKSKKNAKKKKTT